MNTWAFWRRWNWKACLLYAIGFQRNSGSAPCFLITTLRLIGWICANQWKRDRRSCQMIILRNNAADHPDMRQKHRWLFGRHFSTFSWKTAPDFARHTQTDVNGGAGLPLNAPHRLRFLDVRLLMCTAKQDGCTAEITSIYSVSLGEPQCRGHILFMG